MGDLDSLRFQDVDERRGRPASLPEIDMCRVEPEIAPSQRNDRDVIATIRIDLWLDEKRLSTARSRVMPKGHSFCLITDRPLIRHAAGRLFCKSGEKAVGCGIVGLPGVQKFDSACARHTDLVEAHLAFRAIRFGQIRKRLGS